MPRSTLSELLKILIVLVLAVATGNAQSQDTASLVRSNSRLVLLDVVVTDKAGHPIRGLTNESFSVSENGAPQKILSVESQSTDVPVASRPRTILLLDELNTQFF